MVDLETALKKIRLVILDVDGVLTDGMLISHVDGSESKAFHVHDGAAIHYLHEGGLKTAIITGRASSVVQKRASELGIEEVYQGEFDKVKAYTRLRSKLSLEDEAMAYLGDDLPDIPVMKLAGLAVAVSNARPEVKAIAHYVTRLPGGGGAVREVAELILKAQGRWMSIVRHYLGEA
ncbi:MAG: HAD hydrolase family protein [Planctomycetes bacterium]|nr:HAD hydrolase family protein [Planctomycetota bacterium]